MELKRLRHQVLKATQKPHTMKSKAIKPLIAATAAAGVITLVSWMYPSVYTPVVENDFLRSLKTKLTAWNEKVPEDKVYVQLDKPFYNPGETIWLAAYVVDANSLKTSTQSEIIYVDLIGPKGTKEKTLRLIAQGGHAAGDFELGKQVAGGIYKLHAYTQWQKNNVTDNKFGFHKDITVQDVVLPNLKMKIDFEKKAYGPGDEVEVKLSLNTNENKPLGNHKIKYVAQLNGEKILGEETMTNVMGEKSIRFNLPDKLKTNDGIVNIMIDYNGQTESISRSIPIVLNNISITFFPEGGDLVTGLKSNVAFRAVNEFGKPADIEGIVTDSKGNTITSFSSYHFGMGSFSIAPGADESYLVKITKPVGVKQSYYLPPSVNGGFTMSVDNSKPGSLLLNIGSTVEEELSIVCQVRGKMVYSNEIKVAPGTTTVSLPSAHFPIGIAQFTLFDSKGIERCERLTFVNKGKQLKVNVVTDKEKYLPREKVKMTITVTDERGIPMPAQLSLSVVNDQLLSFADDRSGNILSKIFLESELNRKIEEPNFYFDPKEAKSDKALDYLLMTAGWRRFTWEKVITQQYPMIQYTGEKAVLAGQVYDAYTMKPIANANIRLKNGNIFKTDENGKFIFNKVMMYEPLSLQVEAPEYYAQNYTAYDYSGNFMMYLYPNKKTSYSPNSTSTGNNVDILEENGINNIQDMEKAPVPMPDMMNKQILKKSKDEDAPKVLSQKGKVGFGNAPVDVLREKDKEGKEDKKVVVQNEFKNVKVKVRDNRFNDTIGVFGGIDGELFDPEEQDQNGKGKFKNNQNNQVTAYYRAREFSAPVYKEGETPEVRSDFRNTIYWNPNVEVDKTGIKTLEFYNSDDITSFRTVVEGFSADGGVGHTEKVHFTQMPFAMTVKAPVQVITGDRVSIPVTVTNNTSKQVSGLLKFNAPSGMKLVGSVPELHMLAAGKSKTIYLEYDVDFTATSGNFEVTFKTCGMSDAFTRPISIKSQGFPVSMSLSGSEKENKFSLNIKSFIKGSLRVKLSAFPSVVGDLLTGVEGILQEPHGCFEQTSMSTWPNTMVLDYLKSTDSKDEKVINKATDLLKRGYDRLVTFETKDKGYEWFGASPGHEGLTAYGIMQFTDMKNTGASVDEKMLKRTTEWLMNSKDGKGGFTRNSKSYHAFGSIKEEILNGYIVYALSDAGVTDIKKELESAYSKAMDSKDPYQLAMMGNALYSINDPRADKVMSALYSSQQPDGSFNGKEHSITHSTGKSLQIETTSLAILAMLKAPSRNGLAINNAVQFLVKNRSGYGSFGNTQGTVLALKALTEYAKKSRTTKEDGTIEFHVNGKKVGSVDYKAGDKDAIVLAGMEQFVKEGNNDIKVNFVGAKDALPFTVAVDYNTLLPNSDEECVMGLTTKLNAKQVNQGETVRLTATIKNKKDEEVPSPMVIIGIPAGLSVQPWQLKELLEKKVFDFYEIIGNNIALYYRGMAPKEMKEINLDLKADIPGIYEAPSSCAYLYYTNEFKTWTSLDKIKINKPE